MSSPKRFFLTVSKFTIVFFALLTAPQYLAAQTYQQDTSTINHLLISAKSKRFSDSATALRECFQALALAKKHNDGLLIYNTYHRLGRIHEVNNALKYSKTNTEIEIDYRITTTELLLSIKDNGIGMDKTYSDKIFKLFQRLDRVTHKESVGIGLTICKNIVDKYTGRLWFDSVVNEGTTFYIAFPKSMISDVPTAKGTPQYFGHFAAVAADLSAV
jgi:light-regulated signal transduction histidine kinase (bacteriophytochrome)